MNDNEVVFAVVFITMIIILLIAGVTITIFIANRQRLKQEMKLAELAIDYEKELRITANEVQEQVLLNISRELHDNIGQHLWVTHMLAEQKRVERPEIAETIKQLDEMLLESIHHVRLLGRSLNSELLEHNGLIHSINQEMERFKQLKHVTFAWNNDGVEPELSADQRLMAFRIFQEVINNSMKHSKAKNISVSLYGEGNFRMLIKDDGKGFDLAEKMKTGGSGLKNIVKRASLANFKCKIETATEKGFLLIIE